MALDVGGRFAEAERAYEWLRAHAARRRLAGTRTTSATTSRSTRSTPTSRATSRTACGTTTSAPATPAFLERALPDGRARDRLRARQPAPDRRDRVGRRSDAATARARCSPDRRASTRRCAARSPIAERLGHERPDWELSLGSLAIAIAHRPERFLDKDRWAMDWYYPILGGVLRGHAAEARASRRSWDTFVVAGPRRALRLGPAVGHRGRDVRARDGARRDRAARARAASSFALGAVPPPRRRRLLDRHELRRRALRRARRATTPPSSPTWNSRGGRARRQRARRRRARPRDCSAARASPRASPPRS